MQFMIRLYESEDFETEIKFWFDANFKNGGKPEKIVKEKKLAQVIDEGFIQETIDKFLAGKADPNVTKELLMKALEKLKR